MKNIVLTRGKVAVVDDADFPEISQWRWYAARTRSGWSARRDVSRFGRRHQITMHREITRHFLLSVPSNVRHNDGDGLNNTRANLTPNDILTDAEKETLVALCDEKRAYKEIANDLGVSRSGLIRRLDSLRNKLGMSELMSPCCLRVNLVKLAIRRRYVEV